MRRSRRPIGMGPFKHLRTPNHKRNHTTHHDSDIDVVAIPPTLLCPLESGAWVETVMALGTNPEAGDI